MKCPYCSGTESKVTNKRGSPIGIRRRRECLKCKKRFTTYEKIEMQEIYVLKKDRTREKFDIKKIRIGVEKAFEKRPISKEKIDKVVEQIEENIRKRGIKEIKSSSIGEIVMKKIRKMDEVAYIRFASVYLDFQNKKDFEEELDELKESR